MDKKLREASYQGYETLGKQRAIEEACETLKEKYPEASEFLRDKFKKLLDLNH